MHKVITPNFRYSIKFDEHYKMLLDNYPAKNGWMLSGGWRGRGVMNGSFLGLDMEGYTRWGSKFGYNAMLAEKVAKKAIPKLSAGSALYLPCKTNVFKFGNSSSEKKMIRVMMDVIGDSFIGDYIFGYDESKRRYFFSPETELSRPIILRLDSTGVDIKYSRLQGLY